LGIRGSLDARPRLNEVTACEPVRAGLDSAALAGGADPSLVWPRQRPALRGAGAIVGALAARFGDRRGPLLFADAGFDAVAGNSLFTHMNERNQFFNLGVFRRATCAGAMLLLTVSGTRVLDQAETGSIIAVMLALPKGGLTAARAAFDAGPGFCFLRQHGDPASSRYEYEVTFLSQACIARHWPRYFELQDIVRGAIRHFQDIVGLRRHDDSVAPEPER